MKAEKKHAETASALFQIFSEAWKSRRTPFRFEKQNGSIVITGYKSSLLPKAEIPAELQGFPVKKVGARAFLQCDFIEEAILSDGVEEIGANAFSSCERLTKVYMADSVRLSLIHI